MYGINFRIDLCDNVYMAICCSVLGYGCWIMIDIDQLIFDLIDTIWAVFSLSISFRFEFGALNIDFQTEKRSQWKKMPSIKRQIEYFRSRGWKAADGTGGAGAGDWGH